MCCACPLHCSITVRSHHLQLPAHVQKPLRARRMPARGILVARAGLPHLPALRLANAPPAVLPLLLRLQRPRNPALTTTTSLSQPRR